MVEIRVQQLTGRGEKMGTTKRRVRRKKKAPVRRAKLEMKKILVPIDFSEHSFKALEFATGFAKHFGASLILLHVVEPTVYPTDFSFGHVAFPNVEDELYRRSEDELARLRDKLKKRMDVTAITRLGKPFLEITEAAKEHRVDLIIIASHGHTGMEHILFGSTAEKVIRKAHCHVLTVRPG
jgi:nucleotide-binding universal stress UspA family protein